MKKTIYRTVLMVEVIHMENWKATYYNKNNKIIDTILIKDRTEYEAEKEAIADMPYNCDDWTLMSENNS